MNDDTSEAHIRTACYEAASWVAATDEDDCAWAVEVVIGLVIEALRRDPRIDKRTLNDWDLFFADTRRRAEDILSKELRGLVDYRQMINAIVEELSDEADGVMSATDLTRRLDYGSDADKVAALWDIWCDLPDTVREAFLDKVGRDLEPVPFQHPFERRPR